MNSTKVLPPEALINASGGKTFVLFTSYDLLNKVFNLLDPKLRDYPLYKQGDLSPSRMLEKFRQEPSVIFGTNSFWQGVDIPGDALSSVVITKLPFDVPSDPLVEARVEDLKKRRINPFRHFQIPRAIIQLRQGFGRLIRTAHDRGVVSILDSRIVRRGYGEQFIASLPPCIVCSSATPSLSNSFMARRTWSAGFLTLMIASARTSN